MKTVALISGGKDSCYNMMQCIAEGHEVVALANLKPKNKDELDSYMYQTVGHHAIDLYAEATGLPLYRREIEGSSRAVGKDYTMTEQDEVEDLYELLKMVQEETDIEAVSVGAILSNYQRVRVENVCSRLGLTPLAYLWRRDQKELLHEMIQCHVTAILIKVAALGLKPKLHLGKSLAEMQEYLHEKSAEFDLNICGEGGEYETFTLDCPLFKKRIVLDETETVIHSDDPFAAVGYLNLRKAHLEEKNVDSGSSQADLVSGLPMQRSSTILQDIYLDQEVETCANCDRLQNGHTLCPAKDHLTSRVFHYGSDVWISGLTSVCQDGVDISQLTRDTMGQLSDLLRGCGPGWDISCLVLVHLYVGSMADFAAINLVYRTFFGINPAARVCVQASLPSNIALQLDCYGHSNHDNRETMHVQGLSHWAPANIGPYSQCTMIGDQLYVAGQIGMVPANLSIIKGGIQQEARLSLHHVDRVLSAMCSGCSINNVATCVCYLTHENYIPVAKGEFSRAKGKGIPCECVYAIVPMLPKGALVEWQVRANKKLANSYKDYTVARTEHGVECVMKCMCTIEEDEEEGVPRSTLCSITGSLTLTKSDGGTPPPDVEAMIELLYQCHQLVGNKAGLSLDSLPITRIFYPSFIWDYSDINKTLEKKYDHLPFTAVPVVKLEREDMILSVCQ